MQVDQHYRPVSSADFSEQAKEIRHSLRARAYGLCGDWHMSDDIVQNTLVIILQRWDRLKDSVANLEGYAKTVLLHEFLRLHQRAYTSREISREVLPERPTGLDDEDLTAARVTIRDALDMLPDSQRTALILRYWADLNSSEIASTLGLPVGTVRSSISRGLAKLKVRMDDGLEA